MGQGACARAGENFAHEGSGKSILVARDSREQSATRAGSRYGARATCGDEGACFLLPRHFDGLYMQGADEMTEANEGMIGLLSTRR